MCSFDKLIAESWLNLCSIEVGKTRMSETKSTTEATTTKVVQHRLYRSTYIVAGLVLLLGVIANMFGEYVYETGYCHGWPWVFYRPSPGNDGQLWLFGDATIPYWVPWQMHSDDEFQLLPLLANCVAIVAIAAVVAYLWQWRCQKVKRWYQFTITDWFLVTTSIVFACYCFDRLYEDYYRDATFYKMADKITAAFSISPGQHTDSYWSGYWDCADAPYEWCWDLLQVPLESRPYRRHTLHLEIQTKEDATPQALLQETPRVASMLNAIVHYRHLEKCWLRIETVNASVAIPEQALENLGNILTLNRFELSSSGDWFTDAHAFALRKVRCCEDLEIANNVHFQGVNLSHLKRLKTLVISNTQLNDQGLMEIAQLEQLETLSLQWNEQITPQGWSALERMKSLKYLTIANDSFSIEGFKALESLTSLTEFKFTCWEVPAPGWKSLAKLQHVQKLEINSPAFNDLALTQVATMPALRELDLANCTLTRHSFATFKTMPALEGLRLNRDGKQKWIHWRRAGGIPFGEIGLSEGDESEFIGVLEGK
jgi:hypothetical protein